MDDKIDRELIARHLINTLDVKNCHNYKIFMGDDLLDQLEQYSLNILGVNELAIKEIKQFINEHKNIIDKIANNSPILLQEKNDLIFGLMDIKRKYILKK